MMGYNNGPLLPKERVDHNARNFVLYHNETCNMIEYEFT